MLETDADRLNMLRALGGSDDVRVRGIQITGLLDKSPLQSSFEQIEVSTDTVVLHCLMTDVRANGFAQGDSVEYPGDPDTYFVADIQDEAGVAILELRKE